MTDEFPLSWLFYTLAALLACSAFFAMSETCLMALNRYRLKHLIREGSRGARLAGKLLERTDELLAFILAGNTLINAAVTILVAEICRRLLGTGDYVLAVATLSAGFFILVFAEILPKVIGATYADLAGRQHQVRHHAAAGYAQGSGHIAMKVVKRVQPDDHHRVSDDHDVEGNLLDPVHERFISHRHDRIEELDLLAPERPDRARSGKRRATEGSARGKNACAATPTLRIRRARRRFPT